MEKAYHVVDIGANIGAHSLRMGLILSFKKNVKDKKVYAFEPGQTAFEVLKYSILKNNLNHVIEAQ